MKYVEYTEKAVQPEGTEEAIVILNQSGPGDSVDRRESKEEVWNMSNDVTLNNVPLPG